jgi:hypothetical protein
MITNEPIRKWQAIFCLGREHGNADKFYGCAIHFSVKIGDIFMVHICPKFKVVGFCTDINYA